MKKGKYRKAIERYTDSRTQGQRDVNVSSIGPSGSQQHTLSVAAEPAPRVLPVPPAELIPADESHVMPPPEELVKEKTKNSQLLADWGSGFEALRNHMAIDLLLDHEHDPEMNSPCSCSPDKVRRVQCHDCTQYRATCSDCFVKAHKNSPFHWAEVWSNEKGYFERRDACQLDESPFALYLGHNGDKCPSSAAEPYSFYVVHTNGVHSSKIHWCWCDGVPDYTSQLFKARLFPATTRQPKGAFTLQVLHAFHLHHLEGNTPSYDYISAIRRLTDNVFFEDVQNYYENWMRSVRVFRLFTMIKRLGLAHRIESVLTSRDDGNLVIYCPACPDRGVNMELGWEHIPPHMRHINQTQDTLDGNYQANRYGKNSDQDDVSLTYGHAYFPEEEKFKKYLVNLPAIARKGEKSTCNYIRAANHQDRKKFKNMEVTGVVTCQCSHVCVWSVVDLQFGERHANVDYALAMAIRRRLRAGDDLRNIDFRFSSSKISSYDAMCIYAVNIVARFEANEELRDLVPIIKQMKFSIPALHVQNHKDDCMYEYSTAYMECVGHFHGETAEMLWPELNQLGPQGRQMNNGNRQGMYEDKIGDWNWLKTVKMAEMLATEIVSSSILYLQKYTHFKALSEIYIDKTTSWEQMSRQPERLQGEKRVRSVYRHDMSIKAPSQAAVYESLVAEQEKQAEKQATLASRLSDTAGFLNLGMLIQRDQRQIQAKSKRERAHTSQDQRDQIKKERFGLSLDIKSWRDDQQRYMDGLFSIVNPKSVDNCEDETLYLPSQLSEDQRQSLGLQALAREEILLRVGEATDAILDVQVAAKSVSFLAIRRKKQDRGQEQNTRSLGRVKDAVNRRDMGIMHYMAARHALEQLGYAEMDRYPPLTPADTYRAPTFLKRSLGASRKMDGIALTAQIRQSKVSYAPPNVTTPSIAAAAPSLGTPVVKRKATGQRSSHSQKKAKIDDTEDQAESKQKGKKKKAEGKAKSDGWIWLSRATSQISEEEMNKLMDESDRVQWFRAEAEYQRWREHWEMKQADMLRCIRQHKTMKETWTKLVDVNERPGHKAYARQKAAMWGQMEERAREKLTRIGYGDRLDLTPDKPLWKVLDDDRKDPEAALAKRGVSLNSQVPDSLKAPDAKGKSVEQADVTVEEVEEELGGELRLSSSEDEDFESEAGFSSENSD